MSTAFQPPRLMLVTDRTLCPLDRLVSLLPELAAAGVDAVQLREKDLHPDELLRWARALRRATAGRALLFVNGNVEVALACAADGVQLGETALPVRAARARAGAALLIGRSVHDVDGAVAAARDGADLLVLGTLFPSRSHPGGAVAGTALVRAVRQRVRLPLIGIGGVTAANAGEVCAAGADGVAVISAILAAPDPAAAAAVLREAIASARTVQEPVR